MGSILLNRASGARAFRPRKVATGVLISAAFGLAACSSLDVSDMAASHTSDELQTLALAQPPIDGALSLDEALARSFMFNLDYQVQRLRAVQSLGEVGLSEADYLPRVMLAAGYTRRSNIQASVGKRVDDASGELPTDFFTATDQSRTFGTALAAWNLIDFGLSYLENEKQKRWAGNDYEAAQVSCASLADRVVSTYWRALAFERAEAKNDWLRWRLEIGLAASKTRADAAPETRTAELFLQRELIDLFRWYDSIYVSLSSAKDELAGLINLPPGTEFALDLEQTADNLQALPSDSVELVKLSFANRPELRQRLLLDEFNQISNKQDMVRLFPGLSVLFGGETDSNSFLLNNSFTHIGASLSWDLFELARTTDRRRQQTNRAELLALETQLVANAVASQVAMAVSEYQARNKTIDYAWRANTVQAEITDRTMAQYASGEATEAAVVKEELLRELAIIRWDVDTAGHQAARIRVLNALGLGPDCAALPVAAGYEAVRTALRADQTLIPLQSETES